MASVAKGPSYRPGRRDIGQLHGPGDLVDEQENESRGGNGNRYPIEAGEIEGERQRKRDGGEQCTSNEWSDLSDDKSFPVQILKSEILTEGTNDHEQENANGNLSNPQFRWSRHGSDQGQKDQGDSERGYVPYKGA